MVAALTTNTDQYLMSDDTVMAPTTACQTQQNMREQGQISDILEDRTHMPVVGEVLHDQGDDRGLTRQPERLQVLAQGLVYTQVLKVERPEIGRNAYIHSWL